MDKKDNRASGAVKKYILPVLFIAFALLLDQITKNYAQETLSAVEGHSVPLIDGVFNFTLATNAGAAWSMFSGSRVFLLLVTFAAFALIFYIFRAGWINTSAERWTMYSVIGGALGNLYDRLFREGGLVIDFFDFELINFPVFNVADIFISVGGVLFILFFFIDTIKSGKSAADKEQENDNH